MPAVMRPSVSREGGISGDRILEEDVIRGSPCAAWPPEPRFGTPWAGRSRLTSNRRLAFGRMQNGFARVRSALAMDRAILLRSR